MGNIRKALDGPARRDLEERKVAGYDPGLESLPLGWVDEGGKQDAAGQVGREGTLGGLAEEKETSDPMGDELRLSPGEGQKDIH